MSPELALIGHAKGPDECLLSGAKRTFACNCNSATGRYSLLVRRKETNRIVGAASMTTGSIVTHEMTQDNSQCVMNWVIVITGKLAIPAAIRHVSPA